MKFKLTEHQLKKVVFKYLDRYYSDLNQVEPYYYHGNIFTIPGFDDGILALDRDHLFVHSDFIDKLEEVFPIERDILIQLITNWFSDKADYYIETVAEDSGGDEIWTEDDN
jgi:hypothetical protein